MMDRLSAGAAAFWVVVLATAVTVVGVPELSEVPDQSINEGLLFRSILLSELVSDPDYGFDELTWTFSGTIELAALPFLDRVMIRIPDDEWSGSETILFEVCNPDGECASCEATFTVNAVNDPPVLSRIPHRIVRPGELFEPVPLLHFATDIDDEIEDLVWSVEGDSELDASIEGGVLAASAPSSEWIGSERLRVRVCDSAGDCAERDVVFARVDGNAIAVTLVQNAGFAVETGGVKLLIDALLTQSIEPEVQEAMRAAVPPFDADIVLITHHHSDHFNVTIVVANLQANPDAIVVSTRAVIDRIVQAWPEVDPGRLIAVELAEKASTAVEALGLRVGVYEFPHGVPNVGFLFSLGPWTVFHPGDVTDTQAREWFVHYTLVDEGIDIALVPWFLLTQPQFHGALRDGLRAGLYVPMHITTGFARTCEGASAAFDNVLCFDGPMDVWVGFPYED